ncbi:MAG: HipA domain-containing protein [Solirubrobacteraceae bacterium]|nr:HipA domain-containing protein [Solirubrobacteraceae bacterium]
MTDELCVILDDRVAGVVQRARDGRLRFAYDDAHRSGTPLSVSMPPAVTVHEDAVIRPWLRGLLPEDDRVLRRWARRFHTSTSPFALLASPVGQDCPGAVRFAPADEVDAALGRRPRVTWLSDDEVGERLRDLREDGSTWLGRTFSGRFSLAGAQAKTALLLRDGRWGEPSGTAPTTHILKPAIRGLDDHDLNEHRCLDAARRVGLLAARTRVARFGDETAVVVERYDRRPDVDGTIRRIHQEDLCQALGVPPERKYQNEGGPTPGAIAALLRDVLPASRALDAVATRCSTRRRRPTSSRSTAGCLHVWSTSSPRVPDAASRCSTARRPADGARQSVPAAPACLRRSARRPPATAGATRRPPVTRRRGRPRSRGSVARSRGGSGRRRPRPRTVGR